MRKFVLPLSSASIAFIAASMFGPPTQLSATPDTLTTAVPSVTAPSSTVTSSSSSSNSTTSRTAQLRVAQWGIDRAPIDVSLDMTPWASNMSPGSATSYLEIKSGRHKIYIAPADKIPGAQPESSSVVEVQLEPGSRATLFPRPLGMSPAAVLVSDALPAAVPNTGHIRVVNLSEQQGTLWVSSSRGLGVSSEHRKSTGFVPVSPGSHEVRIGPSGTAPYLREGFVLNVPSGEVRTLVIIDAGPGIDAAVMNDVRPNLSATLRPAITSGATTPSSVPAETGAPAETTVLPQPAVLPQPTVLPETTAQPETSATSGTTARPETTLAPVTTQTRQTSEQTTVAFPVDGLKPPNPNSSSDQTATSELALATPDASSSNDAGILVAGIQGAGLALALSELARRLRRRSA